MARHIEICTRLSLEQVVKRLRGAVLEGNMWADHALAHDDTYVGHVDDLSFEFGLGCRHGFCPSRQGNRRACVVCRGQIEVDGTASIVHVAMTMSPATKSVMLAMVGAAGAAWALPLVRVGWLAPGFVTGTLGMSMLLATWIWHADARKVERMLRQLLEAEGNA